MSMLGSILSERGQSDRASKLLREAYDGLEQYLSRQAVDGQTRAKEFANAARRLTEHFQRTNDVAQLGYWRTVQDQWTEALN